MIFSFLLSIIFFTKSDTIEWYVHFNADTLSGTVVRIIDGDTFDILTNEKRTLRVRMYGIDCPERRQDYYQVCKQALADMIAQKDVILIRRGYDRNKRLIAEVLLNNENINISMIANGFAWHFIRYSSDAAYAEAEKKAKAAGLGLWKSGNAVAPWEYRQGKKRIYY